MGVKAALPRYELYFYNVVLCMAMLWAARWIFDVSSSNSNRKTFKTSVQTGWYYSGRKMDTADVEWMMWFSTFREHIIFALSGHVIFAKICTLLAPQLRSLVFMVYGLLAVFTSMGWAYVTLILSHCVLLYSISLVKLRWLCFVAGLTTLATFKMEPFISWQAGFVTGSFELRPLLFYSGCGFTIMRCLSFALENCERKDGNYSILELLKYNFYLPFFYFGPIMTFDKFYTQQANNPSLTRKDGEMWNISIQALLNLGVIIIVAVILHFMYILTIPSDMKLLKHISDWALVGLAYLNLVYDWVKAAVMFGVINTVSRLDHLDPPKPPKCITMLYVFSETHFDRGINDFLCNYVYNYLGGKHDNVLDELIASLCTFGITALWLGPSWVVFIWAFLNCFGLNFELWTTKFFTMEPFISIEMAISESMSRRIRAVFNAFNFWTIVLYNVLALNSLEFANLVAKRLFLKGFPFTTITVMFVTYCLIQLIKERERRQALIDDPDPIAPPPPPTDPSSARTDPQPVDPNKQKAE
ncbi:protein-cysteine N-palmitoyltransferase HHAT-like protein isoform X1 [Carassius gibelio]|uniref:protein-cysteine N-palmitoyltransferase HHAT-like protein isoform X1 n=1 Tax=Carassius gibelio TaxID=101364 RepID=UPI00227939E5|nr:protein-cysteine N-palmitoyltransferase HHAT-like protein isoform X1 [Carassius gibelio]